jgi:cellulose synthase/poly-beta-1,6-N-acetylglucosamine synthase-like glycosyltransferase
MTARGRLDGGFAGPLPWPEWYHEGPDHDVSTRGRPAQIADESHTRSPGRHRKDAPVMDALRAPSGLAEDGSVSVSVSVPIPRCSDEAAMGGAVGDIDLAGRGDLVSLSAPVPEVAPSPMAVRGNLAGHIVALLPAYNEAADIATALHFLRLQSRRPDRVIVIANNCTDNTAEVAAACGAEVMVMERNQHKKAGALNYALERVLPGLRDEDAVLVQDADSFLDPGFIAATAPKLDQGFGAAGGNFRGRPGGRLCGILQRNEYARYARDTARKQGDVLCITGVGTLFRVSALREVAAGIRDGRLPDAGGGYIYSHDTLTEDNWMTLALKHLGYRVVSPKDATMSTEVMLTWRALARQRLRWKRGAFEDLLSYGLTRHTLKGWGLQGVSVAGVFATLAYLGTLAVSPWLGFHVHRLFIALTGVYAIERAITVRSRGWKAAFASMTVFGEWFYDLYLQAVQLRALWGAVRKTSKTW